MSGKMMLTLFDFWCDINSKYLLTAFEILTLLV